MKLTVYRPQSVEYIPIDVDLMKKPGKGLGLSIVARKSGKGVYISDIVSMRVANWGLNKNVFLFLRCR